MKKESNQQIPQEFIDLFGKPLTLDEAVSRLHKSASEIASGIEQTKAAKRQEGEK